MKKSKKNVIIKTIVIVIVSIACLFLVGRSIGLYSWGVKNNNEFAVLLPHETDFYKDYNPCDLDDVNCGEKEVYGIASWYDYKLDGVWWSKSHRTCASRDFPRYSYVEVTNLDNGKSVVCYVNDWIERPDRVIDLSSYAFSLIADKKLGLVNVKITEVK